MIEQNALNQLQRMKQIMQLSKQAGIDEVPMKVDTLIELADGFAEFEKCMEADLQKARHKAWLRGVADTSRHLLEKKNGMPSSPYEGGSDD